jgi:hypothetical protein
MTEDEKDELFSSVMPCFENVKLERANPEQVWVGTTPTELADLWRVHIGEVCWEYVCQRAGIEF